MALVMSGDAEFQVVWAAKRWTKRADSILLCGQAVESCHMDLVCASSLPCESELAPWVQTSSRSLTAIAAANRHA